MSQRRWPKVSSGSFRISPWARPYGRAQRLLKSSEIFDSFTVAFCTKPVLSYKTRRMRRRFFVLPLRYLTLLALVCSVSACTSPPDAPAPPQASEQYQRQPVDCAVDKCVALTFDDGPGRSTNSLLDELDKSDTPATFFLIGRQVQKYPKTVQRMANAGHQLGNHTWDHSDLTTLSDKQIKQKVAWTSTAIEKITGDKPSVFRPPMGRHNPAIDKLIPLPLVLWDINTRDGRHHDPQQTMSIAMDNVQPGSIILMHDVHATTVKAVPELISRLKAQGYTPVTVDQLLDGKLQNSVAYSFAPHAGVQR
ncbi:polysaccharide deacetylase [Arthrobacter sp. S41]|nr:polysaccharide deacetylase [Arthrobacter sp. S41]